MLHYDRYDGTAKAHGAALTAVLLHGRGADENDLTGLRRALPSNWTLIFPRAPFSGAQWGYGGGYAWYQYLGSNRPEPGSYSTSLSAVGELLDTLPDATGNPIEQTLLGGFSQGGTLSLGYAIASRAGALPGSPPEAGTTGESSAATRTVPRRIANLSGFLPDHPAVRVSPGSVEGTRFFWAHGRMDPAIPYAMATEGRSALRNAGADLTTFDEPGGHWIEPDVVDALVSWAARE